MEVIESVQNKWIKKWKKLLKTKGRKKAGAYIIEGYHLIEEAIASDAMIQHLILREDVMEDNPFSSLKEQTIFVSDSVAKELSDTETSQGVFAVIEKKHEGSVLDQLTKPVLLLDAVQDPGNVGTMIRSADAAGFGAVVLGNGTVDAYNPKTLRSAQGSHFHIPLIEESVEEVMAQLQEKNIDVYGTALDERAVSYKEVDVEKIFGLIVGNEGAGVNDHLLKQTDANLYIPIKGKAESLNVAIAASVLMFSLN